MLAQPIQDYLRHCRILLLEPTTFFRTEFSRFSLNSALVFGLVSAWLSTFILFMTNSLTALALQRLLEDWIDDLMDASEMLPSASEQIRAFLYQGGVLLLYPFLMLIYLGFWSFIVFIFAKAFIPAQSQLNYKNCLKILALASGSLWLALVPVLGQLIAYVLFIILVVIGVREVFWVSTRRATLVVLAPQAILFFLLMLAIGLIAMLAFIWSNIFLVGGWD